MTIQELVNEAIKAGIPLNTEIKIRIGQYKVVDVRTAALTPSGSYGPREPRVELMADETEIEEQILSEAEKRICEMARAILRGGTFKNL